MVNNKRIGKNCRKNWEVKRVIPLQKKFVLCQNQ